MTEPTVPSTPPTESGMGSPPPPAQPSAEPPAGPSASGAPSGMAMPAWSSLSSAARLVMGGSVVVFVAALLGIIVEAWELDPYGLIAVVVALVAGGAAWMLASGPAAAGARAMLPGVQLAAGAVGSALAALAVIEMLFDLDQLDDDYGGFVGLLLAIVLAGGALAILWGALRREPDWAARLRGGDQGTRIAIAGVGLVLIAWALHLSIGFWSFAPASWGIAAIVLAGVVLFVRAQLALPFPASWIAIVLGLFAAWTAFGQWNSLMDVGARRVELDLTDLVPFLIYVVGIVAVLAGSVMVAMAETRRAGTDTATTTPTPPASPTTPTGDAG